MAKRDIVQFVPFRDCRNNGPLLAEKVLPRGPFIARASGAAMLVAGSWLILT